MVGILTDYQERNIFQFAFPSKALDKIMLAGSHIPFPKQSCSGGYLKGTLSGCHCGCHRNSWVSPKAAWAARWLWQSAPYFLWHHAAQPIMVRSSGSSSNMYHKIPVAGALLLAFSRTAKYHAPSNSLGGRGLLLAAETGMQGVGSLSSYGEEVQLLQTWLSCSEEPMMVVRRFCQCSKLCQQLEEEYANGR